MLYNDAMSRQGGGFSGSGNNSSGCQSHRWGGVLSSRMLEVLAAMAGLSEAMAVAIRWVEVSPRALKKRYTFLNMARIVGRMFKLGTLCPESKTQIGQRSPLWEQKRSSINLSGHLLSWNNGQK